MWRNVSWNSTDSSLPDGMHRHETGAYFKTPSIKSGTSGSVQAVQPGAKQEQQPPPPPPDATPHQGSSAGEVEPASGARQPEDEPDAEPPVSDEAQWQASGRRKGRGSGGGRQQQQQQPTATSASAATKQHHQHQGFRSRLSSISGALQHPKLARRLFSGHHGDSADHQHHQPTTAHLAPIQITTTSIDSPQHGRSSSPTGGVGVSAATAADNTSGSFEAPASARLTSSSSGRRLSQLFLPQLANNPILINQMQDPYAANELIPPHLLGLYGQPPLVGTGGAGGASSPGGHRASWADVSLFGRLSNVRPSIDSAFQAAGPMRHSFDARK